MVTFETTAVRASDTTNMFICFNLISDLLARNKKKNGSYSSNGAWRPIGL
jgi:hypothetical protein